MRVSYIIILAYLLCNILNWSIGKVKFFYAGKKWVVHCIIVLFLVIAAILINPYGYKMLIYPYENMQDTLMLSMIAEWAPPDAKDITTLFFQIIPMLLGVIALIQYQGSIRAHHITIFFLFIILYHFGRGIQQQCRARETLKRMIPYSLLLPLH